MGTSTLAGFGERKFSGFSTHTAIKNPSAAQQTAMRLLQPLQLAKQASEIHEQDAVEEYEGDSPSSKLNKQPTLSAENIDPDSPVRFDNRRRSTLVNRPSPNENPFLAQKDFIK